MNRLYLQQILIDQKEAFLNRKGLIQRDMHLDNYLRTKQIVVITGVRRCGKSSLMFLIQQTLQLDESEVCYCNFDDERITSYPALLNDIYALHIEMYQTEPVFFFDEIQLVPGWERFANRMYEQGHKIFVTGSNATLLSSEISTSLTGRNKVIELFPFSFAEYLRFLKKDYALDKLSVKQRSLLLNDLGSYISMGGFPLVVSERDLDIAHALFQDILYRDIVVRFRLTNVEEIREMALFLASNIGKLFSYATLQKITGIKSLSSIKNYLSYFEAGYLFHYLRKFDYSVKKQIMNSRKVYAIDNALPNRLGFGFSGNRGRLLENVVLIELLRRGHEVFYHSNKHECDFLIRENMEIVQAIQVVYELNNENYSREINGLNEAMAAFNIPVGIIIVNFENDFTTKLPPRIDAVPAYKWLLEGNTRKD